MTNTRRNLGLVLLGIGLLVVAIAGFALLSDNPTSGDVAAVESALRPEQSGPLELGPPPTSSAPVTPQADPDENRTVDEAAVAEPVLSAAPVGLRIEALDVEAPITPYGVDERTGQMDVPDNVTDVGWYKFGPSPGDAGSAVLAAHVDLAGSGPGVFFDLNTLGEGDRVYVLHEDGSESPFRVVARTTYDKDELPLDIIFSREGPPVLTLITCGGGFNSDISRYDSNVVVYAVPELGTEPTEGSTL